MLIIIIILLGARTCQETAKARTESKSTTGKRTRKASSPPSNSPRSRNTPKEKTSKNRKRPIRRSNRSSRSKCSKSMGRGSWSSKETINSLKTLIDTLLYHTKSIIFVGVDPPASGDEETLGHRRWWPAISVSLCQVIEEFLVIKATLTSYEFNTANSRPTFYR